MLMSFVWTYATIYSTDVQWGTIRHTLTNSTTYSVNSTWTYATF
jgi:hypothetical protein